MMGARNKRGDTRIVGVSSSWMFLSNSKTLFYELFENWIWFWIYYMPIAIILDYFLGYKNALRGLLIMIPIAIMVIIKRNTKKLYAFLGFNLLTIAAVFLISPSLLEKVFFTLVAVIYFIYCFKDRYSEVVSFWNFYCLYVAAGFMAVCFLIAFYLKLKFSIAFISVASFNIALSSALYINLTRTQKLLEWEVQYAAKFLSKIKRMKLTITLSLISVITFINVLLWKTGVFGFLDYLQESIRNLFVFGEREQKVPPKPPNSTQGSQDSMAEALKNLGGDQKPNIVVTIIVKIIEIGIIILCAVIALNLIWMVYMKLKELYRRFYSVREEKGVEREIVLPADNIADLVIDKLKILQKDLAEIFEPSNRRKIRNAYYKIILRYRKKGISVYSSNTPYELEEKISSEFSEKIEEATNIYEKARYAKEECSEEDIKKIKRYL